MRDLLFSSLFLFTCLFVFSFLVKGSGQVLTMADAQTCFLYSLRCVSSAASVPLSFKHNHEPATANVLHMHVHPFTLSNARHVLPFVFACLCVKVHHGFIPYWIGSLCLCLGWERGLCQSVPLIYSPLNRAYEGGHGWLHMGDKRELGLFFQVTELIQ